MRAAALLAAAVTLAATPALAQGVDEFGAYGGRGEPTESPQDLSFELRFGPYVPSIDEGLAGEPFAQTFGDATRWMLGMEVDWQALRLPKTLSFGPGVGVGYTSFSEDALLADGTGRSAQGTSLSILPAHLVGVLRVDALAQRTPIPLAAHAKLGVGYALWWAGDDADVEGEGASYGLHWAVGGLLLLDALDPGAAVFIDTDTGVNNSYLFFEWYESTLDGFGSGGQMRVGSRSWLLGLALEI
ncbi:MAG: hypothetical protein IT376_07520 [Polyangiaceae bacterium]|nr:hypothetical protein [Polyangiaceae bacterium]